MATKGNVYKSSYGAKKPSAVLAVLKKIALYTLGLGVLGGTVYALNPSPEKLDSKNSAPESAEPLFLGSTEVPRIIKMQEDLLTLGYPLDGCGANGIFGDDEQRAVNWFQKTSGAEPTEYADYQTLKTLSVRAGNYRKLQAEFGDAVDAISPLAKADMRRVQAALEISGYKIPQCRFNGVGNEETTTAIEKFQRDQQIFPVTGHVDAKTRQRLRTSADEAAIHEGLAETLAVQKLDVLTAVMYAGQMTPPQLRRAALDYIQGRNVPEYIVEAVVDASERTGMDFTYLMDISAVESGNKPWVESASSSAVGSFQFIEASWLTAFRKYGEKYGYGKLVATLNKPEVRDYVLDLRKDPKVAAIMAAEFAQGNLQTLQVKAGGRITKSDLYMAHFLGASEAARFINEFRKNPAAAGATLFPAAAQSNAGIFYNGKEPRSLAYIHQNFAKRMSSEILRMTAVKKAHKMTDTAPGTGS